MTLLFWSAIGLIAYIFAGYPLLLAVWSAVKPRPWRRGSSEPNISIVIAAHNEAESVLQKIQNLLSLDYPNDRLEILIGSDGSTDGTAELLLTISDSRVGVFIFPNRSGTPAVLNVLIPKAASDMFLLVHVGHTMVLQAFLALVFPSADWR